MSPIPDSTTEQIGRFGQVGVAHFKGLISQSLVAESLLALSEFEGHEKAINDKYLVLEKDGSGEQSIKYFQNINFYIPTFWKFFCSELLHVAEQLLGQKVYFYNMGLHDKCPRVGTVTPMHQDNFYWCLDPPDALTAYVALDDQDERNGGIFYILESFKRGTLPHTRSKVTAFSSTIEGIDGLAIDEQKKFLPSMQAGDVIFHHSNTVHGAGPNGSELHRRAVAVVLYGENSKLSAEMKARWQENLLFNRGYVINEVR